MTPANKGRFGGAARWIILGLLALGIAAAVFAVVRRNAGPSTQRTLVERVETGEFRREVSGTGTVVANRERSVSFTGTGTVNAILVAEGDEVAQGDVLATLETTSLERDLASTRSSLASARAELNRTAAQQQVDRLELDNTVLEANNAVAAAQEALSNAQNTLNVTMRLFERGAASQNELDTASEAAAEAQRQLSTAQANVQAAQSRVNSSAPLTDAQTASAEAQISGFETTIANLEEQISEAQLNAPFAGTVSNIGFEVGDSVPSPEGIEVVDTSQLYVRTTFDENRAAELRAGQSATITPDADASQTLDASVRRVSRVAVRNDSAAQIEADLDFVNDLSEAERGLIRPGFTVTSRVSVNDIPEALLVPLEAISEEDGESYVYRVVPGEEEGNGTAERLALEILDRNATVAAAEGGLESGDLIALINLEDLEDGALVSFDTPEDTEAATANAAPDVEPAASDTETEAAPNAESNPDSGETEPDPESDLESDSTPTQEDDDGN